MSVKDIDIKVVKEEVDPDVVEIEDERCAITNNFATPVNCSKEIIREPGKGVIVLLSRVSLRKETLEDKREGLDKKNGLVRKQNEPAEKKRARLDWKNKRKRKQNETAEQKRARLEWKNERRRRQQQNETPEQRCQRLAKNREHQRLYSLREKEKQNETPEQRRQRLAKQAEVQRRHRLRLKEWQKNEPPEQRCQRLAKQAEVQRRHRLRVKEKISRELEHQFVSTWKHMTNDELAEECKQILLEKRDKWGHKVKWDEGPDGKLLMTRKELENVKKAYQMFLWKKRKDEQMSVEERAQMKEAERFRKLVRTAHMTEEEKRRKRLEAFVRKHAYKANLPEEKRERQLRLQRERTNRAYHNRTEEQRKRYMVAQKRATKNYYERNKEKLREKIANQTSEQRLKQLQHYRINQAKRLLKRKLEAAGTPQDEIQKQVDQLVSKMKSEPHPSLEHVSAYKPRPRKKQLEETAPQTSSSRIHDQEYQDCRNLILISSTTSQIEFPLGSMSQNVEGCSSSHVDPPSPSLPSCSIFQEQISVETMHEEGDMEDYKNDDDTIATPAHSPPPSPTFYNDQDCSIVKKASVRMEESIDVPNVEGNSSPPLICQLPALPSAAPWIPATYTSLLNEKKCPHCPSSFPEDSQLQSHIYSMHQNKCWKCPKCSSVVLSSEELREHFKSHHAKPEPRVEVNPTAMTMKIGRKSEVNLNQFKRSKPISKSVKTLPFICMKCPCSSPISTSQFETVDKLFNHVRISHPKAFWPCPQCKLLKYNQASLKVHSKICTKRLNS